ncbi:hypothetical protein VPH35_099964 [Triticum aestivum]
MAPYSLGSCPCTAPALPVHRENEDTHASSASLQWSRIFFFQWSWIERPKSVSSLSQARASSYVELFQPSPGRKFGPNACFLKHFRVFSPKNKIFFPVWRLRRQLLLLVTRVGSYHTSQLTFLVFMAQL